MDRSQYSDSFTWSDSVPFEIVKKKRHVVIVGAANHPKTFYDNKDLEIWTMARVAKIFPRLNRVYEFHDKNIYAKYQKDIEAAISKGIEVYMKDPLPGARNYPYKNVFALGGFLKSSISWMIGHAIFEGVSEISLYGCPMAAKSEYGYQRESMFYYIGIARGKGIIVNDHTRFNNWNDCYQYD